MTSREEVAKRKSKTNIDYKKLHTKGVGDEDESSRGAEDLAKSTLPVGTDSAVKEAVGGEDDAKKDLFSSQEDGGSSGSSEDDSDGVEATIRRVAQQLKEKQKEEKALKAQRELDNLQRQLAEKETSVEKLKGERISHGSKKKSDGKKKSDDKVITMADLRASKTLKNKVKVKMAEEGLNIFGSDSDVDEIEGDPNKKKEKKNIFSDSDSEIEVKKSVKKSRAKKNKKKYVYVGHSDSDSDDSESDGYVKKSRSKSGILSKSSDHVKHKQMYPQAYLRFEHVNSKTSFETLDINLFVAGELEIISDSGVKSSERLARLELLKRLMYLSSSYEFTNIKNLYAAVLREIELGHLAWGDSFQYVENSILSSCVSKKVSVTPRKGFVNEKFNRFGKQRTDEAGSEDKAWFCSLYQRHKCEHKSAHMVVVKGSMRLAQHICATCYQKDKKKLEHPECSSSCPYFKTVQGK